MTRTRLSLLGQAPLPAHQEHSLAHGVPARQHGHASLFAPSTGAGHWHLDVQLWAGQHAAVADIQ
jgi:hypothetical protein